MIQKIILLSLFGLSFFSVSYAQDIAWQKMIWNQAATVNPYSQYIQITGMVTDAQNNMYIAGSFIHYLNLGNDTLLVNDKDTNETNGFYAKYNKNGRLQWVKTVRSSVEATVVHLTIDEKGYIYLAGEINKDLEIGRDSLYCQEGLYMAKMDLDGNVKWLIKTADGTGNNGGIRPYYGDFNVKYGKIIFTGMTGSKFIKVDTVQLKNLTVSGGTYYISEWDTSGYFKWAKNYGSSQKLSIFAGALGIDQTGNSYIIETINYNDQLTIGANIYSTGSDGTSYLAKFDSTGNIVWSRSFGFGGGGPVILADSAGNFITSIGGYDRSSNVLTIDTFHFASAQAGTEQALLLKFNTDGKLIWGSHVYGIEDSTRNLSTDHPFNICQDKEGNIYTADNIFYTCVAGKDTVRFAQLSQKERNLGGMYLTKYSDSGKEKWIKQLAYGDTGATGGPKLYLLSADDSENIYFTGYIYNDSRVGNQYYANIGNAAIIGKFNSPDTIAADTTKDTTGSAIKPWLYPNTTLKVYPNPSHSKLFISFHTSLAGGYLLSVTNITGKTIFTKSIEAQPGENTYLMDTKDYAVGAYTISIGNGTAKQQVKFIKE